MSAGGRIWPPGVGARLPVGGYDIKTPYLLAVVDSERADPTGSGRLSPCRPDVDQVAVHERRHADEVAFLRVGDLLFPNRMALLGIECQQKAIIGTANDLSVGQCRAALSGQHCACVWRPGARPDHMAIRAIDSDGIAS